MDRKQFFSELEKYNHKLDVDLISKAYDFSEKAHDGQFRFSKEPFISHCTEVANILLELQLGTVTVASALIHDVVEDTHVTMSDLKNEFGEEIATIVDGVTKMGGLKFNSVEERQVENYRKMLLSMAKDVRIILVKFADRLHNMRTLEYLPEEKQYRIAMETREVYAPLAHRFGVAKIRWELEDLSFKYIEPKEYREVAKKVAQKRREREKQIKLVTEPLIEQLEKADIAAEVSGRPKHLYSVYRKMVKRSKPFEEIFDLMAIRVLTESVQDCYHTLGIIHTLWIPLQDRFKDYIATPKSNMYQALHTTVYGPKGQLFEIQIRTNDMHRTAEYGIAAHWRYKEDSTKKESDFDTKMVWLRQVLDWQRDMTDPKEFMEFLRIDLFRDEVFVFTPKGDLKQLPVGSTPIDFAFAVHTEIGYRCAGSKVNGRIVPLHYNLKSGDTVEILTSANQRPSKDWINFVKTSSARSKVRHWVKQQELESSIALGKELLEKEFKRNRRKKVSEEKLVGAAKKFKIKEIKQLYAALGSGNISIVQYWKLLFPDSKAQFQQKDARSPFGRVVGKLRVPSKGIKIQGVDNLMIRYAQCCQPVPGDNVMGYITKGRGVSIHRTNCTNVLRLIDTEARRIDIDWSPKKSDSFIVRLLVRGTDRKGLFADVAKAISNTSTNIQSANLKTKEFEMWGRFVVQVENLDRLQKVIGEVKKVPGILEVERREYVSSPGMEEDEEDMLSSI